MQKHQSLTLCGEVHSAPMHVCGFFDSEDERYEVILPYLKEGMENNEEVLNILETTSYADHCKRLSGAGIPVAEKLASKQLKVLSADETYVKGGTFAADKMYDMVEEALINAKEAGYDSIRACGDMAWALKNVPGTDELIEYEARLNLLTPKHSCSLICMYDINRFSRQAFADILATHPYVIINGKLHKNPDYIEPLLFLPTLMRRRKRSLASEG
jgi:hypothetical protein